MIGEFDTSGKPCHTHGHQWQSGCDGCWEWIFVPRFLGYPSLVATVTDGGLLQIAGLTQLEWLNCNDNRITDAGLAHLAGLARSDSIVRRHY